MENRTKTKQNKEITKRWGMEQRIEIEIDDRD
jgi:hypothetical protein